MDIDGHDSYDENRANHQERLQRVNTVMAIDLISQFLQNKATSRIFHLACRNMPKHRRGFTQRIHMLVVKSSALRNSEVMTPEALVQLILDTRQVMSRECKTSCLQKFQEERDPIEVPVPHPDTRLGMLLSITPLVVVNLIKEEESAPTAKTECRTGKLCEEQFPGKRCRDLVSCLRSLGDYQSLLTPPESIISAANQAAAKAMMFISEFNAGNAYFECISMEDMSIR